MSAAAIRILLVDDHALFRESVGRLLDSEPGFRLAGQCASVEEAMGALRAGGVDVVLLDFDLGRERGPELLLQARECGAAPRFLMVTAGVSDREARASLAQGASGIFHKHHPPELLFESIRAVMRGETSLEPTYLRALLDQAPREVEPAALSVREREVLRGIFEGLANKEIGERLGVSESSVKLSVQQLFRKSGVRTRGQLVRFALEHYRGQW